MLFWLLLLGVGVFNYWQTQVGPSYRAAAVAEQHWREAHKGDMPLPDRGYIVDPDGAHFVHYAMEFGQHGNSAWRVRHTMADGPKEGREVRWAMLNIWWLRLLGEVRIWLTGEHPNVAIRNAAAYSGPILLMLGLAGWSLGLALTRGNPGWKLGALPLTALMVLGFATYKDFGFGFPDHHGWHQWAALGLVLGLAVRWLDGSRLESARGWRVLGAWGHVSAASGAAILWIGASQALIIYGTVCASAGFAILLSRFLHREEENAAPRLAPEFWRWWGIFGGGWALFFYLLENAPSYFSYRLEINHPLYILLWVAAGEALCRWSRIVSSTPRWGARGDWLALAACFLPVAAVGLTLYLAPVDWLFSKHPNAVRTIALINEANPGIEGWKGLLLLPVTYRYIGIIWVAAAVLLWPRRGGGIPARAWMVLAMLGGASAVLVLGAAVQDRWLGQATAVTAALAACVVAVLPSRMPAEGVKRRWGGYGILVAVMVAMFVNYGIHQAWRAVAEARQDPKVPSDHSQRVARQIAINELIQIFQQERPHGPPALVVNSPLMPLMTTTHLYAPVRQLGTFYWENFPSLWDSIDLLAEDDEEEALEKMRRLGVEYIVVSTMPEDMTAIFMMQYGKPEPTRRALAMRLANPTKPTPPAWLAPVAGTESYFMESARLKIYRFVPPAGGTP